MKVKVENEEIPAAEILSLTIGQKIDLDCKSEGGNPITSLIFTKNGANFENGPLCKCLNNTLSFVVTEKDHGSVLGCSAQNQEKWQIDSQTVELNVLCKLHMILE